MPEIHVPWKALLRAGLEDDRFREDVTTQRVLGSSDSSIQARVVAKSHGIWVGADALTASLELAREFGFPLKVVSRFKDGARIQPKNLIIELSGSASFILALERTLLNLVSYSSGIATQTDEAVSAISKIWKKKHYKTAPPRVTATRKILPHYRELAWHSVLCGGGKMHRLNLSSGILIKENHLTQAESISDAIAKCRTHPLRPLEIEVQSLGELKEAVRAKAETIMLDNFSSADIKRALKFLKANSPGTQVEVSGGVRIENLAKVALPGVHRLSLGSLTHSVKAVDFSLLVETE